MLWPPAKTIPFQLEANSIQNASLLPNTLGSENRGMGKLTESQTFIITDAIFLLQELMAADYPSPNKPFSIISGPHRPVCTIFFSPQSHENTSSAFPTLTTNSHCFITELSSLSSPTSPNFKSYAHFIRHDLLFFHVNDDCLQLSKSQASKASLAEQCSQKMILRFQTRVFNCLLSTKEISCLSRFSGQVLCHIKPSACEDVCSSCAPSVLFISLSLIITF